MQERRRNKTEERKNRKEYMKRYYQEHKQERDAKHAAWVEANRSHVNEYLRNYRKARKQKGTEE